MGRGGPAHPVRSGCVSTVIAFVDTNILVRHLTGDPPDMAERATRLLSSGNDLLLADLVVAEAIRSLLPFEAVACVDPALLLRAVEVYEVDRIDFAEAYLVACAETTGVGRVVSFDRSTDRVDTVERVEPT